MTRVRYLSSYLEWVSHQDFKNIAYVGFFRHFVCVFVFVVVFVIVFVFVFVSSYDFWIAFIISFQNMYGYRGLWSLRAEIFIIFEVMMDIHTYYNSISTYRKWGTLSNLKDHEGEPRATAFNCHKGCRHGNLLPSSNYPISRGGQISPGATTFPSVCHQTFCCRQTEKTKQTRQELCFIRQQSK